MTYRNDAAPGVGSTEGRRVERTTRIVPMRSRWLSIDRLRLHFPLRGFTITGCRDCRAVVERLPFTVVCAECGSRAAAPLRVMCSPCAVEFAAAQRRRREAEQRMAPLWDVS